MSCQIPGPDSQDSQYEKKNFQMDTRGPGGKQNDFKTRKVVALTTLIRRMRN